MNESNGTVQWRLGQLEKQVEELEHEMASRHRDLSGKIDRLVVAIVGAALTFTVSVAVFAITILVGKGTP